MSGKTRHGHYSDLFEEEVKRIKSYFSSTLGIDITWTEATSIAAMRSENTYWDEKKLRQSIAKLRGVYI